jgi:predicted homoserine dehydrogenase-like protein
MIPLKDRLIALESKIRVGIIGIGSIGKGLVFQTFHTPGMIPVAIADIRIERAIACAEWLGMDYRVVDTLSGLDNAIEQDRLAICESGELLSSAGPMDVVIEASNAVYPGANHAKTALTNDKHVVMMNYEAELMYGPYLLKLANEKNRVYTCADGDQPTVIKGLIDDLELWGFDLVMGGNIKGFLDRYTDPVKILPEAEKRSLDPVMCSSYTDGSKLCVEMAVLANAIDGRTLVPGMFGHRADSVHDIFQLIDFSTLWQKKDEPLVDYLLGAKPYGGVFAIGYTEDPFQQYTLSWFPPDMGPGPFYLFYRPYHLGHIEAMSCVAEACLDHSARLQPRFGMKTNVYCYAKKDLRAGDILDGMGGHATYGLIENTADNSQKPGLPQLLSENVRIKHHIGKDRKILVEDCELDLSSPENLLYQAALNAGAPG